jgi:hypothetical protein
MKKSLTISDSLRSSVKAIQENVFKNSPVLKALGNTMLTSKLTFVPFTQVPGVSDTAYVVGGLEVTKALHNIQADITDETMEDASINVESSLEDSISAQLRMKLEAQLITKLGLLTASVLTDNPDVRSTIIKLLAEFNPDVFTIAINTTVVVSYADFFELCFQGDPLTKQEKLTILPCSSIPNESNDVYILHAHGSAVGYELKTLEHKRKGATGTTEIHAQGTFGAAFSTDFVKRATY